MVLFASTDSLQQRDSFLSAHIQHAERTATRIRPVWPVVGVAGPKTPLAGRYGLSVRSARHSHEVRRMPYTDTAPLMEPYLCLRSATPRSIVRGLEIVVRSVHSRHSLIALRLAVLGVAGPRTRFAARLRPAVQ